MLAVNQRKADRREGRSIVGRAGRTADAQAIARSVDLRPNLCRPDPEAAPGSGPHQQCAARRARQGNDELRRAEAEMTISRSVIAKAQSTVIAQRARSTAATAELATAQWRLSRTEICRRLQARSSTSPCASGDTATAEVPLIGIVDAASWRIIANYKQDYIRSLRDRRHRLGLARQRSRGTSIARASAALPAASAANRARRSCCPMCADHRLDPPAAPHPGDLCPGRSAARQPALHGRRRAHRDLPMISGHDARLLAGRSPLTRAAAGWSAVSCGLLGQEICELALDTTRWRQCLMAALVVPLAITMALMLQLEFGVVGRHQRLHDGAGDGLGLA